MSRNMLRVILFDLLAPVVTVLAIVELGVILRWPVWWVVVCTAVCVLIVEGMAVNAYLARRDSVTVGTDDDGPALRTGIVALATASVLAVAVVGYARWTLPDRRERGPGGRDRCRGDSVRGSGELCPGQPGHLGASGHRAHDGDTGAVLYT